VVLDYTGKLLIFTVMESQNIVEEFDAIGQNSDANDYILLNAVEKSFED